MQYNGDMKERIRLFFPKILSLFPRFWKTFAGKIIIFVAAVLLIFIIVNDIRLITRLSSYETYPLSTHILDRNGRLIYEIYADRRATPVKLEELPIYVKQASIAIEDKNFYNHFGFSPTGIARALYSTIFQRRLQGGSTITQQLVKSALLTSERTFQRKIHELYLALTLEALYSKDKILELYLNQIPYGGTAWGIESASQTYFGKGAKDLSLAEAAILAGLPAAPTRFSPFGVNPALSKERQVAVLRRMIEDGYISQDEAEKAEEEKLNFKKPEGATGIHFSLWVKEQLVEEFGERLVEQGGLRVKTTLDLDIQKYAEETVKTEVARLKKQRVGNGAALVTNPRTGEILAMVGSRDYFAEDEDGKVNVTFAPRQPGSAIKPLNYALGFLNRRITLSSVFNDIPTCFQVPGQPLYCPVNYDASFHGPTQARFALGNSYNLPAVKMLALNGVPELVTFAKHMGLTTLTDPARYGLSLTLGGGEVKMVDMAVAFGVFANQGLKQPLVSILEVRDWQGKLLKQTEQKEGDRALPIEVSFLISHILSDNNARIAAFGPSSYLNVSGHPEVSVKTGTTNDRRDNWTIGYNSDILAAAWVGNNDNTPMSGAVSGISGASPIWNRVMKFSLDRIEAGKIPGLEAASVKHTHPSLRQPDGIIGVDVCSTSGLAPSQNPNPTPDAVLPTEASVQAGCATRFEYFIEGTEPQTPETLRQVIHIDKTTGQLATDKTPPENWELQEKSVVTDVLGNIYCLDCPPPSEPTLIHYPLEINQ